MDAPRKIWKRWLGQELPAIDAGTVTKRREIRDAINTETKLRAGTGIEIGIPNQEGKRTVAVAKPQEVAGGALGAEDAFRQPALNQKHDWRVAAIERGAVVVKLTRKPNSAVYESENPFRLDDTAMASIEYTRLPTPNSSAPLPDGGKFIITTTPNSAARNLANLFPNGTVTHFAIRLGATEDAAKSGRLIRLPVEKVDSTDTLKMRTKRALVSDEEDLLASAKKVYAQVNFVVREWRRDAESDLTADIVGASSLGTAVNIGDITSDGTSLLVVDRTTFKVVAFTNGKEDPLKSLDGAKIRAGIIGTYTIGLTTDGTNLYVLSDYSYLAAFTPNGEYLGRVNVPEGGRNDATSLTYDGSHLLVGGVRNRGDEVGDRPRVRPYTTDLVMAPGIPHHMGRPLENVDPNRFLKVGALAFGDGVLYVGNKNTGLVHAFVDGIRDETKEPPATVLEETDMKGMTVHNGRLYVAVDKAAKAYVIPRDRYAFSEGYHYTTLNQDGLRNAVNSAPEVTQLPREPVPGQRVKLTATDHLARSGVLTAGSATDGLVGYRHGTPPVGSLTKAPSDDIDILGSYRQQGKDQLNGVFLALKSGSTRKPQAVWINGDRYSVSRMAAPHHRFWRVGDTATPKFEAGHTYRVQVLWDDGARAYPDIKRDDYTWNGQQWMLTPGLRLVHDGGITGIEITDTSAVRKQVPFTPFMPSFDLDLIADGALSSQLELEIKSRSLITIGFDGYPTATYREGAMATVGAIKRQAAYPSGAVEGVVVAATPIYDGTDKLGNLRLYLAANASHELGYRLDYATTDRLDSRKELTVAAELTLIYQPFLP